jgi:type II secretory pathway pseudopilin PulG
MSADRSSAARRRAQLRGRVFARLGDQRGDTLIEVLVAAVMVALIATASLGGFADIGHLSEGQRNEEQASALAQQDQARLRGLSISQLATTGSGTGNQQTTATVDGTTYTVTSTSKFISGSSGGTACSGSGTNGAADEVQTTSKVTWGTNNNNGGRIPVIVHGLITPSAGGSLVATVDGPNGLLSNPTGAGLAGVTVSISGPTAVSPVTTDSNGCAVFAGLANGSYTVTYAPPSGIWVTQTGSTTIPTQTATVTATQTASVPAIYLSQAGAIQASFTTTYNGATVANGSDTFVLSDSAMTPTPQIFGTDSTATNSTYVPSLTTPSNFFAYPSSLSNDLYTAYAGGCVGDVPSPAPQGFSITPGNTTAVSIQEPALIIVPMTEIATSTPTTTPYDDTNAIFSYSSGFGGTAWAHNSVSGDYNSTESDNSSTGKSVTVTLPAGTTQAVWVATKAPGNGIANVTVNGHNDGTVDLYSATTQRLQQVFTATTSNGLNGGASQTMTITVSGNKNSSASGYQISIDEVQATVTTVTYGSPTELTTQPDVTLSDTKCANNKDYPPTVTDPATNPGGALQYPGVPATTYNICVDDGTNHVTINNVAVPATGQPITTPTTVTANIYTGGAGYGTGVCT